jgi:L-alanine-DL-glutamate epimerase-like enolase superfamily enzyme
MRVTDRTSLQIEIETFPLRAPLRISGYVFSTFPVLVVTLRRGDHVGRGEASGVYYRGETVAGMTAQLEALRDTVEAGLDRRRLRQLLPRGGARNALDCALWALEAQQHGCSIAALAGIGEPQPLRTTFTLGADAPDAVAAGALAYTEAQAIKLKLAGDGFDGDRVEAARAARPDVWLGIDANQGLSRATLLTLMPRLVAARVALIEQPFPIGSEADLDELGSPIPLAADESVQGLEDLPALVGRFDVVNIKLDKCGGLTEGLMMVARAEQLGLKPMVGCMGGSSLAMAAGFVLGQRCSIVDLDGPIWLAEDRAPGARYEGGMIDCPAALWG